MGLRRALLLAPAWAAQSEGRPRRSRALLRRLAPKCPPDLLPAFWTCEANALLWEGQFARAIALVDDRILPVDDPTLGLVPLIIKLEALLFDGRADEAKRHFEAHETALRASSKGTADVIAIEGFLAFHDGRLEEADAHLRRALESTVSSDPIVSGALYFVAAIAHRRGDRPEAQRLLARIIQEGGERFTTAWSEGEWADLYPSAPVPRRSPKLRRNRERRLWNFVRDLWLGIGVLFFRYRALRARPFTRARLARLVAFDLAVALTLHGLEFTPGAQLYAVGALAIGAPVLLFLLGAEVGLRRATDREGRLDVLGGFYATLPWVLGLWFAAVRLPHAHDTLSKACEALVGIWALAVFLALCRQAGRRQRALRWIVCVVVLAATWMIPMHIGARTWLFFPAETDSDETAEVNDSDDNERRNELAFIQAEQLTTAEAQLAPQRPGIADLYFVGGAGWADQDVFLREVRSARKLFDDRYETEGRSLILANALQGHEFPMLANVTLRHALSAVGRRMDRDEDVLFLLITSHGSARGLAFEYGRSGAFRDETLRPGDLRAMLDAAGIKWRVLVISGCESGAFIAPLRDDHTLIATAASDDRPSYGCAEGNAFTDFGRALFDEELRRNRAFSSAFENVSLTIAKRESAEKVLPSRPQVAEGGLIRAKLDELEKRLGKGTSPTTAP